MASSEPAPEFHIVGDAVMDVLAVGLSGLPAWGGDATADSIECHPGGSALNTAVHVASLLRSSGSVASVSFHGSVGEDLFASLLERQLESQGIKAHLARVDACATSTCVMMSGGCRGDGSGGSGGCTYITCAGAAKRFSSEHLSPLVEAMRRGLVQDAATPAPRRVHVHFGGFYSYGPLRHELATLLPRLRKAAGESGGPVRLTFSVDTNAAEPGQLEGLGQDVLDQLDLFKGTRTEVEMLSGTKGLDEALEELTRGRGCAVVATDGARGARFRSGGASDGAAPGGFAATNGDPPLGTCPTCRVEVKDCTGAGDAFCAGLLVALVATSASLQDSTLFACAAGAANCMSVGGCTVPLGIESVRALLEAQGQPLPPSLGSFLQRHCCDA